MGMAHVGVSLTNQLGQSALPEGTDFIEKPLPMLKACAPNFKAFGKDARKQTGTDYARRFAAFQSIKVMS